MANVPIAGPARIDVYIGIQAGIVDNSLEYAVRCGRPANIAKANEQNINGWLQTKVLQIGNAGCSIYVIKRRSYSE